MQSDMVFEAKHLSRVFGHGRHAVRAVDEVSFSIPRRGVTAIVGQSGCGKTVLANLLLRLVDPSGGKLLYEGRDIRQEQDRRVHWRRVQAVFQDPFSAFNQFLTIRSQLKSSFRLFAKKPPAAEMEERIDQALMSVNIRPKEVEGKYPFELSGGQMQRMLLARVFILRPSVLIADEPTSMVDACSRATILDYLLRLQSELDMTMVFITHDIGIAHYVADSLLVMANGQIVEHGAPADLVRAPQSPITRQLLDDTPDAHRDWLPKPKSFAAQRL